MNKTLILPALALAYLVTLPAEASNPVVVVKTRVVATDGCTPPASYWEGQRSQVESQLIRAGFSPRRSGTAEGLARISGGAAEVHVVLGCGWLEVEGSSYAGPPENSWIETSAAQAVYGGICGCEYSSRGRGGYPWRYSVPGYGGYGRRSSTHRLPPPPSPADVVEDIEDLGKAISPRAQWREHRRREREEEKERKERAERKRREEERKRREEERRRY